MNARNWANIAWFSSAMIRRQQQTAENVQVQSLASLHHVPGAFFGKPTAGSGKFSLMSDSDASSVFSDGLPSLGAASGSDDGSLFDVFTNEEQQENSGDQEDANSSCSVEEDDGLAETVVKLYPGKHLNY